MQGADLILCRNVLMYFSEKRAVSALQRLLGCLNPEGLLLLSAVEAGIATQAGLHGHWAGCNYALAGGTLAAAVVHIPVTTSPRHTAESSPWLVPSEPAIAPRAQRQAAPLAVAKAAPAPSSPAAQATPEALWHHAQQRLQTGDQAAAREALLAYLACTGLSHMQQHLACLLLARSWADQQHLSEAQDWLQRALVLQPDSAMAYWLMALLAQQNGDTPEALLALQKCLYLDPRFILGYFLQANLLLTQGRSAASAKALQVCRALLGEQDEQAQVPQGDGMSCAQLLRLCEQLQGGHPLWPKR